MQKHLIAAIDVGSHAMRMKIGELSPKGDFRELETFRKVLPLGHDTFTTGKISHETVEKICEVLAIFKKTMNDYDIRIYQAMATTAIREASNREYIIDQIKLKTDIDLQIISNSQEQYLTHKATKYGLEAYDRYVEEGAVIVVIGAGTIQVTTYKDGALLSSENVRMGAMRIRELLSDIERNSLKYTEILDEYIRTNLESMAFFLEDSEYKHLVAVGGEVSTVQKMIVHDGHISDQESYITRRQFKTLFNKIEDMTLDELQKAYKLSKGKASILLPSMMMFGKFLDKASTKKIILPDISLVDGIIKDLYDTMYNQHSGEHLYEDILTSAWVIGRKFRIDEPHARLVESNAMQIFDDTLDLHGMDNHDRLLLRLSAIMHDVGKYIAVSGHTKHSYYITKSSGIYGLSEEDILKLALVTRYHSGKLPSLYDESYKSLSSIGRVQVSKLVAILRIADALDKGHSQKLNVTGIKVRDTRITIKCTTTQNVALEEWSFYERSHFFKDVFGLTPVLKIKKDI